jgi:enoyl-CoA hydratase
VSYTCLDYAVADGVATITVSREKALNALNPTTLDELEQAIDAAAADEAVRGVIVTGAGEKAFVAGADLKHLNEVRQVERARAEARRGQACVAKLQACPKPVIACVNGYALGGGLELAVACHFRYATQNAKLGLPEVSLGLIPGYGGTQRLPRLIGRGAAIEMIVTGDPINAAEALRLGLVNKVFETKDAMLAAARETLGKVAQRGPFGVKLALESVQRGLELSQAEGLEVEADLFGVACQSEDAAEGISAFLEKRSATFKGC